MKEEWIAYVLKQTLQGLKYFHDQGQVRARAARLLALSVHFVHSELHPACYVAPGFCVFRSVFAMLRTSFENVLTKCHQRM